MQAPTIEGFFAAKPAPKTSSIPSRAATNYWWVFTAAWACNVSVNAVISGAFSRAVDREDAIPPLKMLSAAQECYAV
jgi:hypothetical protein